MKARDLALALAASLVPASAYAHGADPVGVVIAEQGAGVSLRVDAPASLRGARLEVALPSGCVVDGPRAERLERVRFVTEQRYRCDAPLAGRAIEIGGLPAAVDAVLRVETRDHAVTREVLSAKSPRALVAARPTLVHTIAAFAKLGVQHLLTGLDHVLFVVGLVLLARRARSVVAALTAFTVGHSLTLAASVLHVVEIPSALAEVAIALSLVVLAVRVLRAKAAESPLRLALLASSMGLLHGLGFAYALEDVGLPPGDVPASLFGFNLGIELGQLAVVVAIGAVALAARAALRRLQPVLDDVRARQLAGYALGACAAMWCIERVIALGAA